MKKSISILSIVLFILSFIFPVVNAASVPYRWIVGGESVDVGNPNSLSTARVEKDGKVVTLYLNDYSGGKLSLECYGTGQEDMTFNIKLEGVNTVTSNDIGIEFNYKGTVNFIGNGKLTINAPKPISYESYTQQMYISPSESIYQQVQKDFTSSKDTVSNDEAKENNSTTSQEENINEEIETKDEEKNAVEEDNQTTEKESNEQIKKQDNTLLYIIISVYGLLSLSVIIFLSVKLKKLQK